MIVSHVQSKPSLVFTRFQERFTTTVNELIDRYNSLRRRRVEIPFIWLVAGAMLVTALVLSLPMELDYNGVGLAIVAAQKMY